MGSDRTASAPRDPRFAARVRASFARQGLMRTLGAELTRVGAGTCEIRLPFRDGLSQQHGFFHAGATSAIADSAGGYAALSLMGPRDSVLSVEYKINLLAPAQGEVLVARALVVRAGKTLSVCRTDVVVVSGKRETLCATMQQTVFRLAGRSDAPPRGSARTPAAEKAPRPSRRAGGSARPRRDRGREK